MRDVLVPSDELRNRAEARRIHAERRLRELLRDEEKRQRELRREQRKGGKRRGHGRGPP